MKGTRDLIGRLAIGDNLHVLREHIEDESVDLIYLDPPFNSNRAYSLIFRDGRGRSSPAQEVAFDDSWSWGSQTEARFRELIMPAPGSPVTPRLGRLVGSIVSSFERTQMAAYIVEMTVRLVELHRVLKPTGSLYLHCDPTASHYLKVVLDAIFGGDRFVNEIVWKRQTSHNDAAQGAKHYGRLQDVLLFYSKGPAYEWRQPYRPYEKSYVESFYRHVEPSTGRRYTLSDITAPGGGDPAKRNPRYEFLGVTRYWRFSQERMAQLHEAGRIIQTSPGTVPRQKRYLDEMPGMPIGTWWDDIPPVQAQGSERLGYPTQKPLALLERIIAASSRPDDVILDPFCGCGTAIEAARNLGRRWIGIDISPLALDVVNTRFRRAYGEDVDAIILAPRDVEGARRMAIARHGRDAFEAWALTLIGARKNPGRDRGVDGYIAFVGPRGRVLEAIVSVKSGRPKPADVRDLKGALHRDRAPVGILVTLEEPTDEMRLEVARAGDWAPGIPRLQIITIREALDERRPIRPILPAYRQGELFEVIPDGRPTPALEDMLADLEEQIARAVADRRLKEAARLEAVRRSVRAALSETTEDDERVATRAAHRRRVATE